jgi:hypothetical protein
MLLPAFTPWADAFFVPASLLPVAGASLEVLRDREKIEVFLEEKLVRARLEALGFTTVEIEERLAGLTGSQLHRLAAAVGDVKAGGSPEGLLIGLLIILLVVGVILPCLGIRIWK